MESTIDRQAPPAITHPEYFYGFLGAGLAWQVLFLVLSTDPVRYRTMILPCVLEKVSWGIALIVLLSLGRLRCPPLRSALWTGFLLSCFSPPISKRNPIARAGDYPSLNVRSVL